mgnify:CR=1 FL=1
MKKFKKVVFTCVQQGNHEYKTEDDVDSKTAGHLIVGLLLPLFVFADRELPLVPVFKGTSNIETEEKMKELIQVVFSPGKCIRCEYFDKESGEKVCHCDDEEQAKCPLQS